VDVNGQIVGIGQFTAREKAVVVIELNAGWALELVWMFCRRECAVACASI